MLSSSAGELVRPRALEVLRLLLETNFKLPIHKERASWLHSLYEQHVKPALNMYYKNVKAQTPRAGGERCAAQRVWLTSCSMARAQNCCVLL